MGTGIQVPGQLTLESKQALERAETVFHLAAEPVASAWLQRLRPDAHSLGPLYEPGRERNAIYERIVDEILAAVRAGGGNVCVAFYGHPGVFAYPAHEAIRRARAEGFEARMLPAVSAEDCLFADLGVDPGKAGCQSYEATDFLVRARDVDTNAALLLWQVSVIGETHAVGRPNPAGLAILAERLLELYDGGHEVTLYQASPYPIAGPLITTVPLSALAETGVSPMATLYVPPAADPRPDAAVVERLKRISSS